MGSLNLPKTSLLLLIASCLGQAIASAPNAPPHAHRILRAATKRSDLYRRSVRITKQFETELSYIEDENGWGGKTTFASQVRVASQKPILNLEEIEHHLKDVECYPGGMRLEFVDPSSARDAFYSCGGKAGGLIITSHETCNAHGERSVYKVHDVSFANDGEALDISVTKSLFQDAFDNVDISFGDTINDHLFRRHSDFAKVRNKRQNIEVPANTSEGVTTASFDLSSEVLDTVFPAESFLAGLREIVPIPQLPIEIGCKNCSTSGQILLTQGAFKIDLSQIDLIPDIFQGGDDGKEISNVITGGFLELAATGVGAHVDLFARPKASGNFEIALFSIPIVGFTIPGIGRAGAVFEPRIAADFDISGGFEINYGFEVAVPNDSKIRIELTDLSKSTINGFPGSTLTPLPFRTNITDLDILLGLAFKPNIPVGFEFLEKLSAEVFVSMTLPRIDAKLSSNKGANCGNEANSTLPSAPSRNSTTQTGNIIDLGPIALVGANITVAVDAGFSVKFPLPPPFDNAGLEANLFKTVIPLITECAKPEVAFKPATAIVAAPASMTYANASIKASATPTPQFVLGWNSTGEGYAIPTGTGGYIVKKPLATMQSHAVQTHVTVDEKSVSSKLMHGVTSLQAHAPTPTLSLAFELQNVTAVASNGQGEVTSAALPSVPSGALATGSFQPGNSSSVGSAAPAQQTAPSQFTGAAASSIEVPSLRVGRLLWQVGMLGTSVLFGAMVL